MCAAPLVNATVVARSTGMGFSGTALDMEAQELGMGPSVVLVIERLPNILLNLEGFP